MIKKIYISLFLVIILFSCGKKGDPVYKEKSENLEIIGTQNSTIS